MNEVSQTVPENNIQARGSFQKLKYPLRKTNAVFVKRFCLTLVQPYGTLKRTKNPNTFKDNLQEHCLKDLKN